MTASENISKPDQFKLILESIFQNKIYDSILNGSPLPVLLDVTKFTHEIVNTLENEEKAPQVACRNGCSYCCYSHIAVMPVEALLIFSFIAIHFKKTEQSNLKQKIKKVHRLTQNKTIEERFELKEKTPCIFLRDGSCRIHPVRPLICRAWNSLDADSCKTAFHSNIFATEIEHSPIENYVFGSVQQLYAEICEQLNIQSARLELPHAISRCLETSDPMPHWLAGHQIFDSDSVFKKVDDLIVNFAPDQEMRSPPESVDHSNSELNYVNYFYQKYKGRTTRSAGYDHKHSDIFPFIFQNAYGSPIGIVAMGVTGNGKKKVHLYHIRSFIHKIGDGDLMMKELCRKADCFDIQLSVSPAFMANDKNHNINHTWLSQWYKKFNFKGKPNFLRSPREKSEKRSILRAADEITT